MIWKGFGVLAGTALVVVLIVVGLALLIVPDEPTFAEELEEASGSETGLEGFTPSAEGGQLEITGAVEGSVSLERTAQGPTYGLENSDMKIFFESNPLVISQMSYEGLAFFPEEGDCEFTEGTHNEESGLVAVEISCEELVDIRENGTITVEGVLALPANLVIERDLPDTGGTVTIGNTERELSPDVTLFVFPDHGSDEGLSFSAVTDDTDASVTLIFNYDPESEVLTLSRVSYEGDQVDIGPGQCSTESEQLAAINPEHSIHELNFSCDVVEIPSLGEVPIHGRVVFERVLPENP